MYRSAIVGLAMTLLCGHAWAVEWGGYQWHYAGAPLLVPVWHVVDAYEVQRACGARGGEWDIACVVRHPSSGTCDVYASQSESETPEWIRWHEFLHCAGWEHDQEPRR